MTPDPEKYGQARSASFFFLVSMLINYPSKYPAAKFKVSDCISVDMKMQFDTFSRYLFII